MRKNGQLPRMLHVLVHMALLEGRETSDRIARMLNTNPVVVRRTLGALRDAGIVQSEGGRGGGWKLIRALEEITVLDVQRALSDGEVLPAVVSKDHPTCPVERASNAVLEAAYAAAEKELVRSYAGTTLAQIAHAALSDATQEQSRSQ